MTEEIKIKDRDYWVKIVEMLQHNWALIDCREETTFCFFLSDTAGVFDSLTFESRTEAEEALRRNGFRRFKEDSRLQKMIRPPSPPFVLRDHPNGPIYSSGRYWR